MLGAWHCCLEFYSVVTRLPEEYRLSPQTAQEFVMEEIIGRLGIRMLDAELSTDFLNESARLNVRGGRIYDHYFGSIALNSKASVIITENKKHFALFENKNLPEMTATEFLEASDAAYPKK